MVAPNQLRLKPEIPDISTFQEIEGTETGRIEGKIASQPASIPGQGLAPMIWLS
jgi:hypothetical protein